MVDLYTHRIHPAPHPPALPGIHRIDTARPWVWLAAGWQDMRAAPLTSAVYGLLAVAAVRWHRMRKAHAGPHP